MSVNGLDKAGSTALHWAAHGGHIECLQALLAVPKCEINVQVGQEWHIYFECAVFSLCYESLGPNHLLRATSGELHFTGCLQHPSFG